MRFARATTTSISAIVIARRMDLYTIIGDACLLGFALNVVSKKRATIANIIAWGWCVD